MQLVLNSFNVGVDDSLISSNHIESNYCLKVDCSMQVVLSSQRNLLESHSEQLHHDLGASSVLSIEVKQVSSLLP